MLGRGPGEVLVKQGYWSGLSDGLKIWFVVAVLYLVIAGAVFLINPIVGAVLFVAPAFWSLAKNYLIANLFLSADFERTNTLSGYTADFLLFRASTTTKFVTGGGLMVAVVVGLGWVSTEEFRIETAKPTLTERVTNATGQAVDTTKETTRSWAASAKQTTGNWVSAAKGWFNDNEAQTADSE